MKRISKPFKFVLLLISLLTAFRLNAVPLTSAEEIYLHIDRNKYIAGEDIWFSIYLIDTEREKLSAGSAIAYVELLNPWNEPVGQSRFKLSGGRGEGNLLLPDSISSGTYTIRAYTNRMKNFLPYNCYIHEIDVYNPFKGSDFLQKVVPADSSDKKLIVSPDKYVSTINLKADTIYGRREKVTLNIRISNNDLPQTGVSEMSIAVAPAEVSDTCLFLENQMVFDTVQEHYNIESDGHYLSGRVKYRDDISDSSRFLYMSVQGKVAEFKYARIDSAGRFTFVLPADNKLRNLILQPDHANNNMSLEIEPSFPGILPALYSFKNVPADSLPDVFAGLSFNYQTAKIYGTQLKREAETRDNIDHKRRRFYGIPEMEIILDDYIKLPSMQEVFFELVPGIILRSRKSGYEIKITNPLTGVFFEEPPLVMIDGVIINDLTVLVDLDPDIVEKVEVVKTPYLIGDLVLHGIVNVITRSGDFSDVTTPDYAVILPYRVIDKPFVFTAPDYSAEPARLSRKPDLRNTLYWNPSVKTDNNGEAEIEFWTSDLPGRYIINIHGMSGTGEIVLLHKSFRIK